MPAPPPESCPAPSLRRFDGVVCFGGEDWWYHNRGHYDMRVMQELSAHLPVLYVNSLGMRMPALSDGRVSLHRLRRKLVSLRRGFVRVESRFGVLSPLTLPGRRGVAFGRRRLVRCIRGAADAMGITAPLVWCACPVAVSAAETIPRRGLVYQRTDRYECYPGARRDDVVACDARLKHAADLTIFAADVLFARESSHCRRACVVGPGADVERFVEAGTQPRPDPPELAGFHGPRVGFVGGIDAHTFDAALFLEVVRAMPHVRFVLVGACSLPTGWCREPNVTAVGQRGSEQVPSYMAACDALIMPWRGNAWIDACHPIKLKEYLAVGRPIVSTPFPALRSAGDRVRTAATPAEFAGAIAAALADPGDAAARRAHVAGQTWAAATEAILAQLRRAGLAPRPDPHRLPEPGPIVRRAVDRVPATPATVSPWQRRTAGDGGVRACILLAGGLRASPLIEAAGCSVLDLHFAPDHRLLDLWLQRLAVLSAGRAPLPVRIAWSGSVPPPWPPDPRSGASIVRDPRPYRGPAGVAADLCTTCRGADHVLIAEAARLPACDLRPLVADHFDRGAEVTVACNPDGSPSGISVVSMRALGEVPAAGFVDLKEQWLTKVIHLGLPARVHRVPSPGCLPLRTLDQYHLASAQARRLARDTGEAFPAPRRIVHGPRLARAA